MRFFSLVAACSLFLLACADRAVPQDHQAEWLTVLRQKQAAAAAGATAHDKQLYADAVRTFMEKYPKHRRGREVWHRLQLEFAEDLAAVGRHQDAIRFYRAVLVHDPANRSAIRGLAAAVDRLAVSREKLLTLAKGMSHREVTSILGRPMPGWTEVRKRPEAKFEAWYYRTRDGGVAGVYFRDGKVFAAEETSHAKLGRLGS